MTDFNNTLVQTLVIDSASLAPPHYDVSPFGSHTMLRSGRVTMLTGGGRVTVAMIPWADEDALNRAVIRMYLRVAKDTKNQLDHREALPYFQTHPDFFGSGPPQIICEPGKAEQLAKEYSFLSPTIYAAEHMGLHTQKAVFYLLLPAPENLGVAPHYQNRYGLLVQESRQVVAIRF